MPAVRGGSIGIKKLDTAQVTHPEGVKSCRPNLYGKQHLSSQRQTAAKDQQPREEIKSDNAKVFQSPNSGSPFLLNSSQIQFKKAADGKIGHQTHSGNNSMHAYNNVPDKKHLQAMLHGSAGSGSRGSNFNSSASTFPNAPVAKLSEVKNPQKLMTFRFVNRKVQTLPDIGLFKNLQELDLSGNLL